MRLLFTIDTGDYNPNGTVFQRDSSRSILIQGGRIAMVHSRKYDYYKFPGGGIEAGESRIAAVIRETAEEAGLRVIPGSVREYGYVHRVQKNDHPGGGRFIQDNYYFLCQAENQAVSQQLDGYEAEEGFCLEWVTPEAAIHANRELPHGPKDPNMLEREARVLEMLLREGFFGPSL